MPTFSRLRTMSQIEEFQKKFCEKIGYEVPLGYFLRGDCYGMYKTEAFGVIEYTLPSAGFCLVMDMPGHLRSIKQIPPEHRTYDLPPFKTAEFTGYFLNDKKHGLFFTLHLIKTCLFHKASRFVYSYPVSQKKLEAYYASGNPKRLYTGIPEPLPGHTPAMEEEHVEVLTKWGIVKIFLYRTWRYIVKK